jgi:hypothetical protein
MTRLYLNGKLCNGLLKITIYLFLVLVQKKIFVKKLLNITKRVKNL